MKKQLLTLIGALGSLLVSAQSIPNGNFENWTNTTYEVPQYWMCANEETHGGINPPPNVFKTTDSYQATYAIQMNTVLFGTDTIGGWMANGNPGQNTGGVPYAQTPTGIRLYYKSTIMPNDTALVLCIFKKNGSAFAQYLYKIAASQSNYTLFSQTFSPALSQAPDTVIFACAAGNLMVNQGVPGTMMQVDSISFTGATQPANFGGDLEQWQTKNRDYLIGWNGDNPVKTTDKYAGTYAVNLVTNPPGFGDNNVRVGRITTATREGTQSSPPGGGTPYTLQVDTLVFYYKYLPANYPLSTDSARVFLNFSNNGNNFWGGERKLPFSLSYVKYEYPFNLTLNGTPDSMFLAFESSKWPALSSYVGSDLKIDQVYLKSQVNPVSLFQMPSSGCKNVPIQLTDSSLNAPTGWQWFMTGASPGNSTSQNPVITYSNTGTFTVSLQASNSFGTGSFISHTITINNLPTISATSATVCTGTPAVLTASGASTYTWSNAATGSSMTVTPSASATYTVVGTSTVGCSNSSTASVFVPVPATPAICIVTVDSTSTDNIVYWDKTLYNNADSFIVYREVSTNVYARIAGISKDSMSLYVDKARGIGPANGDPNVGSYRYKLQIRDTCGNYGSLSSYHNTVYFIDNQNGTFTWNTYDVEGQSTPVANFILERDDANTNVWGNVGIVSGTQTTLNDAQYATYQTIANWRVQATGFNCTPTAKYGNNGIQGAVIKSKSNITNNRTTGIKYNSNVFAVFPNPNAGSFYIQASKEIGTVTVYNNLGQVVYSTRSNNLIHFVNLDSQPAGIYTVRAAGQFTKIVKQ